MTRADSDPVARECERHIERLEVQIGRALDGSVTVATLLDLRRDPHCQPLDVPLAFAGDGV